MVLSPGVPADLPAQSRLRARRIAVIGEVELAGYFLQGQIIGITGSNGKTTTTAMTGHILKESGIRVQVGGNIGTPPRPWWRLARRTSGMSRALQFPTGDDRQFRRRYRAFALNVTPDHLDRHYTFENYAAAKGALFENQTAEGYAVLNADDAHCVGYASRTRRNVVWFSRTAGCSGALAGRRQRFSSMATLLDAAADVPLRGLHNIENTMAAAAAARLAGATLADIAQLSGPSRA